jgi:putative tricarboxylic transport membrane protein
MPGSTKEEAVKRDEAVVGGVIFLFGGLTILLSLGMPIGTFRMAGPGMFPLCLGIALMILSGIFFLQTVFQEKAPAPKRDSSRSSPGAFLQVIVFLGAMVLITTLFNPLGYPVSAFLLMAILLRSLGMKRWAWNLPLSFGTAAVCYVLFVQWLKIPLPKGWLGI